MAYALVLVFDGVGEDAYWAVNEKLGIGRDGKGDYPPGLLVHTGGATERGWLVSELWDSKASQETFMATRLGEALQSAGVPPPAQIIDAETVNVMQV